MSIDLAVSKQHLLILHRPIKSNLILVPQRFLQELMAGSPWVDIFSLMHRQPASSFERDVVMNVLRKSLILRICLKAKRLTLLPVAGLEILRNNDVKEDGIIMRRCSSMLVRSEDLIEGASKYYDSIH